MAPLAQLVKRDSNSNNNDNDDYWGWGFGGSGWYDYGRWILLAVIIGVFVISFLLIQRVSCRRARHGQSPIAGTAWMVPPSYYQSQQQYQQNEEDAVPMYKQEAGLGDAGHFDANGNFVPYTGDYSKAHDADSHIQPPPSAYAGAQPAESPEDDYAPPPGPPPSSSEYYPPRTNPNAPAPVRKS